MLKPVIKNLDMNTSGIMEIWLFGIIDVCSILLCMTTVTKLELYIALQLMGANLINETDYY